MDADANTTRARKADPEALMEHIRKNPPTVKSIPEVVSLLCAVSIFFSHAYSMFISTVTWVSNKILGL